MPNTSWLVGIPIRGQFIIPKGKHSWWIGMNQPGYNITCNVKPGLINHCLVVHPTKRLGGLVHPGDFNGILVGASRPLTTSGWTNPQKRSVGSSPPSSLWPRGAQPPNLFSVRSGFGGLAFPRPDSPHLNGVTPGNEKQPFIEGL